MVVSKERFSNLDTLLEVERVNAVKIGFLAAGRTGSRCVELAVRCGFRHITVYEPDVVEVQQFSHSCFRGKSGDRKIDAVGKNVMGINPEIHYRGYSIFIDKSNVWEICQRIIREQDMVVICLDDYDILPLLNESLYPHMPLVFGRMFENGTLADCCYTLPHKTACISCCIGQNNKQLQGGQALPIDICLLPILMIRLALGIVHIGTKYFQYYQSYFRANHNYLFTCSQPTSMFPSNPLAPGFTQLIEVRKRCSLCRKTK